MFDQDHHTVIMMQVENEVEIMGDSMDRSVDANELLDQPMPENLWQHPRQNFDCLHPTFQAKFADVKGSTATGLSWTQAFAEGPSTDDLFMANAFSLFIQHVAAAGPAEYEIPIYVNVAPCNEDELWADGIPIPDFFPAGTITANTLQAGQLDITWTSICTMRR